MRILLALLLLSFALPAGAQSIVTSDAPDSVAITIYRDPNRGVGGINANDPQGFALITEKRHITLPQGDTVIRFEGVVDGMIAVSAVVTGLPGGVIQKNRDAKLLSPAALLDGTLGSRVHLRRTNRVTGQVREQEVIIRSEPQNAVVLETPEGFEGLRCSGLPETLVYDAIPSGLSARPMLSVITNSPSAITAEVTLTYLATGFDWGASYVARVAPDGRTLDLSAWLTVANGNSIGLPDAEMLAVAGRLNRESDYSDLVASAPSPYLSLKCWPLPEYNFDTKPYPPAPPIAMLGNGMEDIVVTASRREERFSAAPLAVMAVQEDLGDLKLYRVPMHVDVNAKGQKQVALLERNKVPFTLYYAAELYASQSDDTASLPLKRMMRMKNETTGGLGLPLPSGGVAIFAPRQNVSLLLADSSLRDHAIGEIIKLEAGLSAQHRYQLGLASDSTDARPIRELTLTNAAKLVRKDGAWMWTTTIPANGTVRLRFTIMSSK